MWLGRSYFSSQCNDGKCYNHYAWYERCLSPNVVLGKQKSVGGRKGICTSMIVESAVSLWDWFS